MKGKRAIFTAALVIAGVRLWMQVRGKTKTPFAEWVVGWGVLFFFLALLAETYPAAAGPLAGTVVVGDLLTNGASLFEDLTSVVQGTETGGQILTPTPFAGNAAASPKSSAGSGKVASQHLAGTVGSVA